MADPFASVLSPPPGETPAQKSERLRMEAEATKLSNKIDEELKAERSALKKSQKNVVKILLLGQSESGTSQSYPLIPFR